MRRFLTVLALGALVAAALPAPVAAAWYDDCDPLDGVFRAWDTDSATGDLGFECDGNYSGSDGDFGNSLGGFRLTDDNRTEAIDIYANDAGGGAKWCFTVFAGVDFTGEDWTYSVTTGEGSKTINLPDSIDNRVSSVRYWRVLQLSPCHG
jgi:hypothetical protein